MLGVKSVRSAKVTFSLVMKYHCVGDGQCGVSFVCLRIRRNCQEILFLLSQDEFVTMTHARYCGFLVDINVGFGDNISYIGVGR